MSFSAYGTMPGAPGLRWPAYGPLQQPGSFNNYSYVAAYETLCSTDPIVSASLSVSPSGAGEMTPSLLSVAGDVVSVWMAGGVAGRRYLVNLILTTQSGEVFQVVIAMPVDPTLAAWPLPPAPVPGFGTAVVWNSGDPILGPTAFIAVATGLAATGTNQAGALLLTAQTNVFSTVPPGAGCQLNPNIANGTCRVVNTDTNDLLVYPPGTAQIGTGGASVAAIVSPGSFSDFATSAPTVLWTPV